MSGSVRVGNPLSQCQPIVLSDEGVGAEGQNVVLCLGAKLNFIMYDRQLLSGE